MQSASLNLTVYNYTVIIYFVLIHFFTDAPLQSTGGLVSGKPAEIVRTPVEEESPPIGSKLVLVESTCTGVSQPQVTPHSDLEPREFEAKIDALTIEERLTSKDMIIDQQRERIFQLYEEKEKLVINVRKLEERLQKAEQTSEKDIVKKELECKTERFAELEKEIAEVREENNELKEELRREKKKREKMCKLYIYVVIMPVIKVLAYNYDVYA